MSKPEECSECRFYESFADHGSCHRFPPAPPAPKSLLWALSEINWFVAGQQGSANSHQFNPEGKEADDNDRSQWVEVRPDDWCGEFEQKKPNDTRVWDLA